MSYSALTEWMDQDKRREFDRELSGAGRERGQAAGRSEGVQEMLRVLQGVKR